MPDLGDASVARVLGFLEKAKPALLSVLSGYGLAVRDLSRFNLRLRSANTFPSDAGIASSASSFAAVTTALCGALCALPESLERAWGSSDFRSKIAAVSRSGSGSSCRSFLGPWVLWDESGIEPLESSLQPLHHFVIVLSRKRKPVSSSDAHERVKSSPLGRGGPRGRQDGRFRPRRRSEAGISRDWLRLPYRPVLEIRSLVQEGLLLFVGHHSILAWGRDGQAWESEKLSDEGVTIIEVDSGVLRGTGWDMKTDLDRPFALELRSGKRLPVQGAE